MSEIPPFLLRPTRTAALIALGLLLGGCPKHRAPDDAANLVWPLPPEPTRVKSIDTIVTSEWSQPTKGVKKAVRSITGTRTAVGFKKPYGVVTDSRGRVFVSDTGYGQVLMFDREAASFAFVGDDGQGATVKPAGVAVDSRDHLFVADLLQGSVIEFDPKLAFVRSYGGGVLTRPVGVVVHPETNQLWVTDSKRHVIDLFEVGGDHIRTIGERGTEPAQFNFPTNLDVGPDGNLYIVDSMNFRVQVLTPEGEFVREWGENCDSSGCMAKAKGISVAPDGRVFVVDAAFNLVQIFDANGQLLMSFGGHGNVPGRVVLPAGIHVDEKDIVYLVNQYGWRVNLYEYYGDEGRPPPSAPPPAE